MGKTVVVLQRCYSLNKQTCVTKILPLLSLTMAPACAKPVSLETMPPGLSSLPLLDAPATRVSWPPCTPVLLIVCKRKSPPLLHPPLRSRSLLHPRGNTPSGSVALSCLPSPPSNRCGSPSKNTMSAAHPSSTGSASNFTTLLIYCCNCWHFNCLIDLFFIVI